MALKDLIRDLGTEEGAPCVSISLNTHRAHPDTEKDRILLKNLFKEAEDKVAEEYGESEGGQVLKNLREVHEEIDVRHNLDSLHIFVSQSTKRTVRLPQPTNSEVVQLGDKFGLRPLIKAYSRSSSYLIMVLSQGGVRLYEAVNDGIIQEITNADFPFPESPLELTLPERKSDPEHIDNRIKEYFNNVDKALVKVHNETDLPCAVVCTVDNYGLLKQVADRPSVYCGHTAIDYNNSAPHQLASQSWKLMREVMLEQKKEAIKEAKEAVSQGNVRTDLQEIYQASIDGRGELLIVHQDFVQPVVMSGERTFDLADDASTPGSIEDIVGEIAWNVLEKKGRTVFLDKEEMASLGTIALKTRY